MLNKIKTETTKQQPKSFIGNLGRKFSSVSSKKLAVFALVVGISLTSTPLLAANASRQQAPSIATVQTEQQSSFTQEQNRQGTERMENMIKSLENQIKTNNWDEKEPKKADYYRLLIATLRNVLKNNSNNMGSFAEGINTANLKFGKYEVIVVNNKIEYCSNGYADVTKEYKTGMENIENEIERLNSPQKDDGSLKSAEEIRSDNLCVEELKGQLIDENLIKDILVAPDNLPLREKMTHTLRKAEAMDKVEKNIANAVEEASLGCTIISFITPDSELVFKENGSKRTVLRYAEYVEKNGKRILVDRTPEMIEFVNKQSQKTAKAAAPDDSPQL